MATANPLFRKSEDEKKSQICDFSRYFSRKGKKCAISSPAMIKLRLRQPKPWHCRVLFMKEVNIPHITTCFIQRIMSGNMGFLI